MSHWYRKDEPASIGIIRIDGDLCTYRTGESTTDRQAETYTFLEIVCRLLKEVEDTIPVIWFDAHAGILHYQPDLTTLAADVAPADLSATSITANAATISWTGYGESYNLRYSKGGVAKVTLSVPDDVWNDGTGYQMLLDDTHNTCGTVIPETGGLTGSGDAAPETYANFKYKIPENADGSLITTNVVFKNSVTITIPAGTYDWCVTNPSPNDRVWIASEHGKVGGRQDDFTFEAGKHYTFTVTIKDNEYDGVDLTVEDDAKLIQGDVTNLTGLTSTLYNLSGLTASSNYTIYVQSVRGNMTSEWSSVSFKTLKANELYLYDDQDNAAIIANAEAQGGTWDVTLAGRTLYKDGDWNTLCLPFDLTIAGSVLDDDGVDVRTLSSSEFNGGELTLNFTTQGAVTTIEAGVPYIIKWNNTGVHLTEANLVFPGVTVESSTNDQKTDYVDFKGTFLPVGIYESSAEKTKLYLGEGNTLYYPTSTDIKVNACRAWFQLKGLTAGTPATAVRSFILNFSDDEKTGIKNLQSSMFHVQSNDAWYSLDGRKLQGKPTRNGLYIHNGRKVTLRLP